MAAQDERSEKLAGEQANGLERREFRRHAVDCAAVMLPVTGGPQTPGRLTDLSLGDCLFVAEKPGAGGTGLRVELQFQLRGIAFRLLGVTASERAGEAISVRFPDMPARRRDELTEVLAEVETLNAAKAAQEAAAAAAELAAAEAKKAEEAKKATAAAAKTLPARHGQLSPVRVLTPAAGGKSAGAAASAPSASALPASGADRRTQSRHAVDTSAKLLIVKSGISMPGRILNLSLGGCRIRTEERFNLGIHTRVEAEFYLHGLPFRVGGVSQAILDKNTIGVRFLDMSERRREQLSELIAEIAEAAALPAIAGVVEGGESAAGQTAAG